MPNIKKTFEVKLKSPGKREVVGGWIEVPFSVKDVFGTNGRVPVKVTLKKFTYRSSMSNMGGGCHIIPVRREVAEKAGVGSGEVVKVTIEHDTDPRTVDVPPQLEKVFGKNKAAKAGWEASSFTTQKEFAQLITGAKQEETRERRLLKIVSELEAKAAKKKSK
ncbi:MAG: YdeI/OmpD-associated family protein [Myxococcaceae bacterium]